MPLFDETLTELAEADIAEATINPTGSNGSYLLADPFDNPLRAGASQPLTGTNFRDSALTIPYTDGNDERQKGPIPMSAPGYEGQGDTLFSLAPKTKF